MKPTKRIIYIPVGNRFELWSKVGAMLGQYEGKKVIITVREAEPEQMELFDELPG